MSVKRWLVELHGGKREFISFVQDPAGPYVHYDDYCTEVDALGDENESLRDEVEALKKERDELLERVNMACEDDTGWKPSEVKS